MSLLELQAIRALPEEYLKDGTCTCLFKGYVVAMEANLPAIIYKDGKWIPMDLELLKDE